ncbi:hypothetical protein LPJ68_005763, partial [Coemansia sp. RSA 1086]
MPTASLLSSEEKSAIKAAQPSSKHKILAAAIARVFAARPGEKWRYTNRFGGLVLVKDAHNKASFLRLINLGGVSGSSLLWEQELYEGFEFTEQRPFFYTVVGDDYIFGLDFADEKEAASFAAKVGRRISKMSGKRSTSTAPASTTAPPAPPGRPARQSQGPTATQRILNLDNAKYAKLVKALAAHNITENMLDDPDTAKFIQKFVSMNGSVDNMIRSGKSPSPVAASAPPPTSRPPPPPARRAAPPPPPPRNRQQHRPAAPLPQRQAPLPPPPAPPQREPRQQSPVPPPLPPSRRGQKSPSPVHQSAPEFSSPPEAPPMPPPTAPPLPPVSRPPAPQASAPQPTGAPEAPPLPPKLPPTAAPEAP